jgi:hypothetical protein
VKSINRALIALTVVLLTACTALGVQTPQTFNEKVAVAISSVTTVRETAAVLLTTEKISVDDARNIQNQANNARAGIEVAIAINATDPAAAENRIGAVLVGLNAITAYLTTKKGS